MTEFMQKACEAPAEGLAFLASEANLAKSDWLDHRFPTRKTENWKYTSLRDLDQGGYAFTLDNNEKINTHEVFESVKSQLDICELNAFEIVFINGQLAAELCDDMSQLSNEGLECIAFSNASASQQEKIVSLLSNKVNHKKHMFAALNTMVANDGILLSVNKNAQIKKPVRVVHINTQKDHNYSSSARLLVNLETSSQLTVVEQFVTVGDSVNSFVNSVSEFVIGDNAKLEHYRFQQEQEHAIHIGALHFELHKFSRLESFHLALGGKIKRIDIDVNFLGEGAESKVNGVYLPKNKQHIDYHTCTEHTVPNCTSSESFRGIIGDSADAVFNGRIHIHPDAQKTLAELSNKNLLLSNKAQINTKPELEIYADDVKCAHGATVAQLNDTSLHYMLTRGIDEDSAKVMLSFGFINELINDINHENIADYLRPVLSSVFSKSPDLVRQLA